MEYKYSDITRQIIGAFFDVYNNLGYGFSEKIYENSMMIELRKRDFRLVQQASIPVFYEGQLIGQYYADIIVNDKVIVELKATRHIIADHEAQLLNYLKATNFEVGLLLNFGPKAQTKRKAFSNERKGNLAWINK